MTSQLHQLYVVTWQCKVKIFKQFNKVNTQDDSCQKL